MSGGPEVHPTFGQCFEALQPLWRAGGGAECAEEDEQVKAARDNAVSAVCKMINAAPGALSLDTCLPLILR